MPRWDGTGVPAGRGGIDLQAGQRDPCFQLEHPRNNPPGSKKVRKPLPGVQHTLVWEEEEPSVGGPPGVPWTSLLEQHSHTSIYRPAAPEPKALPTSTFPCTKLFKQTSPLWPRRSAINIIYVASSVALLMAQLQCHYEGFLGKFAVLCLWPRVKASPRCAVIACKRTRHVLCHCLLFKLQVLYLAEQ